MCTASALITACSSSGGGGGSTPTLDPSDANNVYLATVRSLFPAQPDSGLIHLGHTVCDGFDSGLTWPQSVSAQINGGESAKTAGEVIAAAVTAYCPAHLTDLPGSS